VAEDGVEFGREGHAMSGLFGAAERTVAARRSARAGEEIDAGVERWEQN
jgi:hypothetical protein